MNEALQSAKEDREWEKEVDDADILKAGQIGIKVNFTGGKPNLKMKGTGLSHSGVGNEQETAAKSKKVVVYSKLPAIATKSVLAEDVYNVSRTTASSKKVGRKLLRLKHGTNWPFSANFAGRIRTQQFWGRIEATLKKETGDHLKR